MNPGRGAEDVTLSPPPPMPPTSPQAVVSSEDTRSGWRAHTKAVTAAAAAKGGRLLTTSTDGQVKLWVVGQCSGGDAASSPWEEQILDGPHASVNAALLCCALSYNGETACVGDAYGALHCWDLAGPHPVRPGTDVVALRQQRAAATVRRFSFRCHPLPLTDLAIDGEEAEDFRIITASEDGTLVQWALPTPQAREAVPQPVARFVGHKAPVRACVLLPVGGNLKWGGKSKLLASGGDDGTCRLWDCHSTSCMLVVTVCSAMSAAVCALAVSSCGRWLATADEAGWLHIFVLESLATHTTATSDHAAARQRPNPTAGGINALTFGPSESDASNRRGRLSHQGSGVCRLVCDTGRACCVFDLTPRAITGLPAVRLERVCESPSHSDQALCVAWLAANYSDSVDSAERDYVVSGDMRGEMNLWQIQP